MIRATSKAAQKRNLKHKEAQKSLLLRLIKRRRVNGRTRQELVELSKLPINVVTARVVDLLHDEAIKSAGFCRNSKSGNPCMVLVAN